MMLIFSRVIEFKLKAYITRHGYVWVRQSCRCLVTMLFLLFGVFSPALVQSACFADENLQKKEFRALHLVVRRVDAESVYRAAILAESAGFNAVILLLSSDTIPFKSLEDNSLTPHTWEHGELEKLVSEIKHLGLDVIPEIKLLTHQYFLLRSNYPELMFNSATYDPRQDDVYDKVVFPIIDELLDIFECKIIHIGHDEVAGHSDKSRAKWLDKDEVALPAELYVRDIVKISNYLEKRNSTLMMWGDMLLSEAEFMRMAPQHLHGNLPGYGKPARDLIPKSIIIADWHYVDNQKTFDSSRQFLQEGFLTLGAIWKKRRTAKNFIEYSDDVGANGMILSTWTDFVLGEWDLMGSYIDRFGKKIKLHFGP